MKGLCNLISDVPVDLGLGLGLFVPANELLQTRKARSAQSGWSLPGAVKLTPGRGTVRAPQGGESRAHAKLRARGNGTARLLESFIPSPAKLIFCPLDKDIDHWGFCKAVVGGGRGKEDLGVFWFMFGWFLMRSEEMLELIKKGFNQMVFAETWESRSLNAASRSGQQKLLHAVLCLCPQLRQHIAHLPQSLGGSVVPRELYLP